MNKVYVVGVGMTKFEKPGGDRDYPAMAKEAGTKALEDAGVSYDKVREAYVGFCYGDSTSGQRAVYELGMTGIPVVNVNNNCSTASTALFLAARAVRGGLADCALALGFEKMKSGSLEAGHTDREQPLLRHIERLARLHEFQMPVAPWMFAAAGREHMARYGTTAEQFAKIGLKNHKHSVNNPYAQFQDEYTLDDILAAKPIVDPLTRLQCSPTSDGSAAAIVASESFVDKHGLAGQAVEIIGQSMVTDLENTFDGTAAGIVGLHMTKAAALEVYEQAGIGPEDIGVLELHDCFSVNELLTYEALGLCGPGEGGKLVDNGDTTYGGKWVVNPSGGLISKGHPLGATGLAQCAEMTWQVRGTADARQVPGVKVALSHNIGLGGAAVVTAYRGAAA
ncbi:lipid-transfer protein [Kibdelosporangium phytohabitans]|uniref:propanoyl-CoA C-acyltransferase n=1 Tax=Kibdelosporangium phytohabitans TaxID=860235 RepID=A0A0N9HY22_9PSEU|nr:lipid-transfer protein [Kibdelosporangium phytohabitans]ALG07010.1 lipid-transfer protein [Kibdelosporangium phytohabitans]MBE1468301.1 acetyl-CoA acetyltransferase [Kibdelosporangium phytohabitans]